MQFSALNIVAVSVILLLCSTHAVTTGIHSNKDVYRTMVEVVDLAY